MIVYYFDAAGRYSGYGESATLPVGATDKEPANETDIFDGEMWVSDSSAIPQKLTARQARLALHNIGKLAEVPAAIAALSEPQKTNAEIEWEYATHIERSNPFVAVLASALQLTDEQIDLLFIEGVKL